MKVNLYAVQLGPTQIVAAEVSESTAATLLDRGQTLLLATVEELRDLVRRLGKPLMIFSCEQTGVSRNDVVAPTHARPTVRPRKPAEQKSSTFTYHTRVRSRSATVDRNKDVKKELARVA